MALKVMLADEVLVSAEIVKVIISVVPPIKLEEGIVKFDNTLLNGKLGQSAPLSNKQVQQKLSEDILSGSYDFIAFTNKSNFFDMLLLVLSKITTKGDDSTKIEIVADPFILGQLAVTIKS